MSPFRILALAPFSGYAKTPLGTLYEEVTFTVNRHTTRFQLPHAWSEDTAAIIREAIAPFVAQLAATHEELGEARNELHHERTRREEAESARDALEARVNALTGAETYRGTELPTPALTHATGGRLAKGKILYAKGVSSLGAR